LMAGSFLAVDSNNHFTYVGLALFVGGLFAFVLGSIIIYAGAND